MTGRREELRGAAPGDHRRRRRTSSGRSDAATGIFSPPSPSASRRRLRRDRHHVGPDHAREPQARARAPRKPSFHPGRRRGLSGRDAEGGRGIHAIFILFPDPWPKRRHHKNRVLKPAFLPLRRPRRGRGRSSSSGRTTRDIFAMPRPQSALTPSGNCRDRRIFPSRSPPFSKTRRRSFYSRCHASLGARVSVLTR